MHLFTAPIAVVLATLTALSISKPLANAVIYTKPYWYFRNREFVATNDFDMVF